MEHLDRNSRTTSQILPHKAWAAGDTISAILKFTPLTKGVKIVSVNMSLQEKVKTVWKALTYEDVRVVCSKKEALRGRRRRSPPRTPSHGSPTAPVSPVSPGDQDASGSRQRGHAAAPSSFFRRVGSRVQSGENLLGLFRTRTGEESPVASGDPTVTPSDSAQSPTVGVAGTVSPIESPRTSEDEGEGLEEVEMVVRLHVPTDATPSHSIVPIVVSHRGEFSLSAASSHVSDPPFFEPVKWYFIADCSFFSRILIHWIS
jgi:arrestin-related trafficking adapter 4/5/7